MSPAVELPLVFELESRGADDSAPADQQTGRMVEYCPFPRIDPRERPGVGYARDAEDADLCIGVPHEPQVGSLLRVTMREVDGRPVLDALAKVRWTRPRGDGAFWVGLGYIQEHERQIVRVEPVGGRQPAVG